MNFINISGIKNVYSTDYLEGIGLLESTFIGLVETWSEQNYLSFNIFNEYQAVVSPASKDNPKGRAKGGLMLLNCKKMASLDQVLHADKFTIVCRYKIKDMHLLCIIIVVYLPPSLNKGEVNDCLKSLEDYLDTYANEPVIVLGDFNARIGQLDSEFLICNNQHLSDKRISRDALSNCRGKQLLEFCKDNQLTILNGRTHSDRYGDYTFIETIGASVIDYAIGNAKAIELVKDMKICHTTMSPHANLQLSLDNNSTDGIVQVTHPKIIYRSCKKVNFQKQFQRNLSSISIVKSYENFKCCLSQTALDCCMVEKPKMKSISKPWFDKQCYNSKLNLIKALKAAKAKNWMMEKRVEFLEAKKNHARIIKQQKKQFWANKIDHLNYTCHPNIFWSTVRSLNRPAIPKNEIEEMDWIQFYDKILPVRQLHEKIYQDVSREMDADFSIDELCAAINQTKNNKSGGPDGACNEVYKILPTCGKLYLLSVYNDLWRSEKVPDDWGKSTTVMLHKKGAKDNPLNFRPISLLNCSLKIFTQMLQNRLYKWAEETGVLPQSQAGFRKGRSCHENVFILKSCIDIRLRKKKRQLFAFFIDFSRAFPSIPHEKLWDKLFQLGVSAKYVRWLKILYEKSTMQIRLDKNTLSSPIEITEGVLQGEVLSPLLFNLYISEVQAILENAEGVGANITNATQIHMLAYADDMVVLSESAYGMKQKIKALEKYFTSLSLEVNINKTKIVILQRGGRISKKFQFEYKNKKVEIVSEYTYLGIIFSTSGKFIRAADYMKQSGIKAIGALWPTLTRGRVQAWNSCLKLYETCIRPTSLYCADIWAPNYSHNLERVQVFFFKKLLGLNRRTPDAIVRLEAGVPKLEVNVAKLTLETWRRYLLCTSDRYVKQCLRRLIELHNEEQTQNTWISNLAKILENYSTTLSINSNVAEIGITRWNLLVNNILEKMRDELWNCDFRWLQNHLNYSIYLDIIPNKNTPAPHLLLNLSLMKKRVLSQCRTNSTLIRINARNFILNGKCDFCDTEEDSCPYHFLFVCPIHSSSRFYMQAVNQIQVDHSLLIVKTTDRANATIGYINACLNMMDLGS